jgi:phosphoribosylglycinamide formyltransferase-1
MINIGILSSHNGSGYDSLYNAIKDGSLDANISVVISNNSGSNVIKNAIKRDTPNYIVNKNIYPEETIDEIITTLLVKHRSDYIFLSGYMKKLESQILDKFKNKIINSHPSLLPKFGGKGMYGRAVHEAVIKAKENRSGVTIHYVSKNYDEGEFILQNSFDIDENCSVDKLESGIKNLESSSIVDAFKILTNRQ